MRALVPPPPPSPPTHPPGAFRTPRAQACSPLAMLVHACTPTRALHLHDEGIFKQARVLSCRGGQLRPWGGGGGVNVISPHQCCLSAEVTGLDTVS